MKYDGIYSCGHEGVIDIIGSTKDRGWKKEHEFSQLCPECRKKAHQLELEEKNRLAMEAAIEMELPLLTGSEKQVAWATTIRNEYINKVSRIASANPDKKVKVNDMIITAAEWSKAFDILLVEQTSARFWIDNRASSVLWNEIASQCEKLYNIPEDVQSEDIQNKQELTVAPKEIKKSGIAEIEIHNDHVIARYPKDNDFREIVKNNDFKWSGSAWEFTLNLTSGTATDRAAELGNALLTNGFTVLFPDLESKELALSGNFEARYDNWVSLNKNKLSIHWKGINHDFYVKAKLIPSSKWSNGSMLVSVEFYREVMEFAEIMGFKISETALAAIEKYKALENRYERTDAHIAEVSCDDYENRLKEILEKDGVIEDLIDD